MTGTLTVYAVAPVNGAGGTVMFTEALTAAGSPSNRLAGYVLAADAAVVGYFYAELRLTEGATVDILHGTVHVEGR